MVFIWLFRFIEQLIFIIIIMIIWINNKICRQNRQYNILLSLIDLFHLFDLVDMIVVFRVYCIYVAGCLLYGLVYTLNGGYGYIVKYLITIK